VLEDVDLSLVELSDEQMLLAIAVEVGPTGGGVARAFHADGAIACLQTYRGLEVGSAAESSATPEQKCREQESLHGTILCWVKKGLGFTEEPVNPARVYRRATPEDKSPVISFSHTRAGGGQLAEKETKRMCDPR
jgi:hypothetical protein